MRSRILRLVLVAGLSVLLVASSESAGAATLTVSDLGDNGSPGQLRTLMNSAVTGDTIIIPAGTITLSGPANEDANAGGDLDVLKNLIIQGAGAGVTIIDGGLIDGVFDILVSRTLTLSGVTIRNGINSAQAGGGGIRNFGTLILSDAVVSGNEAARTTAGIRNNGGGIRNLATMSLTNVVITGNLARGDGGGIYNEQGSVMTLTDVTLNGNTVEINGGGIYNLGTANLTRVTVSGNNADTAGGGIFTGGAVVTAATAILTNVTVKANTANFAGGGIANFGSTTSKNVILAGNGGVVVPGTDNCSGTITSLGNNLDSGGGCALVESGDLSNTDPLLGPLQDNGGFTFTHALQSGSPAIDAGTNAGCPAADQRGFPRGAVCDIGAYEFASAADSVAPTVSISLPANGSTVSGPNVTVLADASDNVGVAGVQFQLDGGNLGANVTAAPFSVSWNTATSGNGTHALTAVARDAAGNTTTSATVTVTVNNSDTTAPTVSISSPIAGSTLSGTAAVTADATDNVGVAGVQFQLDGGNLGANVTAAPFSVSWNTATSGNGTHTLTAVARDTTGNTTTSASVTVTVDNADTTAPTVSMASPASGSTVSGAVVTLANATDNVAVVGVQFKVDGVNLGPEITSLPYSVSWDTAQAANGSHNLTVSARDAAGNIGSSVSTAVTVNNSTEFNFSVPSGSSSSATISAGATANYALNVAPTVGFTGSIAFTCSGAPPASTCTVRPNPGSVSGHDPTAVTVSVTTTARSQASNRHGQKPFDLAFLWAAALLPGLVLIQPGIRGRKRVRYFMIIVACLALTFLISCGGGSGLTPPAPPAGTPAGTFTMTVAGTAGGVTHSIDLSLTVN